MSVVELVTALDVLDPAGLDRDEVVAALSSLARVRSWVDAKQVGLARRLKEIAVVAPGVCPEADVAAASRSGRRGGDRAVKRAGTLDAVPEMEMALAAGDVSGEHVDVLTNALKGVKPEHRDALAADAARLIAVAERSTPEQFAKFLAVEVARLDARAGDERLVRQRRNIGLRWWLDPVTGMWCFRGQFDPETGLELQGRLENTVDAMFHAGTPDDCPQGDGKQDYLRALALAALLRARRRGRGSGRGSGHPDADADADADVDVSVGFDAEIDLVDSGDRVEVSVVIDLETLLNGLHEHSIIDNGSGADLPVESYRRMACQAAIIPVVLSSAGVVLDQGRAVRLANLNQRRALRAMYATCAIPGCVVRSRHCQPHHVWWWRHGGPTDLSNLLPLCSRHHHAVHEGGWQLVVHPDRSLTITYPDQTTHTTGPPAHTRAA